MVDYDDEEFRTDYYCPKCMAEMWGVTEADARVRFRANNPDIEKRKKQNLAFNAAEAVVAAATPALSKGQRRALSVACMCDAVSPMKRFIMLKRKVMQARADLLEQRNKLLERMRRVPGLDEVLALLPSIDKLEDEVDRTSAPLAFASKGNGQWAFCLAADYADEWRAGRMGASSAPSGASTSAPPRPAR